MGIITSPEVLQNAMIGKIHFSKNFILPENLTCNTVYEILRTSKFPRLKLLPPEYGGIKFNSKGLKITFYNKLEEMLFRESSLANDLLNLGIAKNRILRAEIQINKKYGLEAMLKRFGYSLNDMTFEKIFSLEKCQAVFQYVFEILNSKMPTMVLNPTSIEDLILPDYSPAKKAKVFMMLSLQKEYGYEKAKEIALSRGLSKTFIDSCNHILITNPELKGFLLNNMLNKVLNYKPLFNTS
jgi:hypothetical protein